MATSPVKLQQGYGIGNALQNLSPFSIIANRVPTQSDKARIGTFWIYTGANNVYVLSSVTGGLSNWLTLSNGGAGVFMTLTVNGNITQTAGVTSLLDTTITGSLTQVAGAVSLGADATGNAISIGTGAALKTINIGSQFAGSSVSAFGPFVINSPFAANSTLSLNCWDAAGIYGQQTLATVAGGVFDACRWLNQSPAAGSGCQVSIWVANQGVAGGDAALRFINDGVNGALIGLDTSANQFSMSMGNLGDANTFYTYDVATSAINMPKQPCFSACRFGADQLNVTGNGLATDCLFDLILLNTGTVYNAANGRFTASTAGRYYFTVAINVGAITAAGMTSGELYLNRYNSLNVLQSNNVFQSCNPYAGRYAPGVSDYFGFQGNVILDCSVGDYVVVGAVVRGGTDTCTYTGLDRKCIFSGTLLS
jgi:hypothetical protein